MYVYKQNICFNKKNQLREFRKTCFNNVTLSTDNKTFLHKCMENTPNLRVKTLQPFPVHLHHSEKEKPRKTIIEDTEAFKSLKHNRRKTKWPQKSETTFVCLLY